MSLSIQRVKSRKTAALRKKPQWESVKYMYAVRNDRLPGKTKQTVCGRALGERKDGQCFFVEVDLLGWSNRSGGGRMRPNAGWIRFSIRAAPV